MFGKKREKEPNSFDEIPEIMLLGFCMVAIAVIMVCSLPKNYEPSFIIYGTESEDTQFIRYKDLEPGKEYTISSAWYFNGEPVSEVLTVTFTSETGYGGLYVKIPTLDKSSISQAGDYYLKNNLIE